jgi:hypothetical protein
MARTASYAVKLRRDWVVKYCQANAPTTFPKVLAAAKATGIPELPKDDKKAQYTIRADLHRLREEGSIAPEWVVQKAAWA